MSNDLKDIASHFQFQGQFINAETCEYGHINDTFILYFQQDDGGVRRYVLQRINHKVFKSPENVMKNIQAVTTHLKKNIMRAGGDPLRETVNLVPSIKEEIYFRSQQGEYWRAYYFIEGASTYQQVENPNHFYNAGKAFGNFQRLLRDFPVADLHETIPRFHDTAKRFNDLVAAVELDKLNRAKDVKSEIDFALKRVADTSVLVNLIKQSKIPMRVTHNDTKFNNIMIDNDTGEGICVLDLDTVMPGSALYDFGDSIRFGASSAAEDEKDLRKVWMELELYAQFTKGFLASVQKFLTPLELEYLPFSAKLMTLECGMRFLTDHLNGDVYFKIHRPGHNLDRALTQFKLVSDMEQKLDRMIDIVVKEAPSDEAAAGAE